MVCLSSKCRLALYKLIQKRANLKRKMFEDFSLDQLRKILGMPKGTLLRIQDFRWRVIEPTVEEVVNLPDCYVKVGPIKTGRTTVGYRCITGHKDGAGLKVAYAEVQQCNGGRKGKIAETVDAAWQ